MADDENIKFHCFKSKEEEFNNFLNSYSPVRLMIPPDDPIRGFTPRPQRVCRFCGNTGNNKPFKKKAHVIPEFLGNVHLQSDFECDECNVLFSRNENDLANWLGLTRSVFGTIGKNGVPTFKSADNQITARQTDFFDTQALKISTQNADSGAIDFNDQSGKTEINFTKEPYTPIRMYKCLLKIALSAIRPEEVEQYRPAFNYLLNEAQNSWFDEFAKIICHSLSMSHRHNKPFGLLYKKIDPTRKLPMHVFTLYYETYIFAFPLPFNELDIKAGLYKNLNMDVIYPPAIVFAEPDEQSRQYDQNLNLSSYEKVIGEEGSFRFEMKQEDLKKMMSYDPKTGKSKPGIVDPKEIVGIYFAPEGTTIKTDQPYNGSL